jgi:hypothetical protein
LHSTPTILDLVRELTCSLLDLAATTRASEEEEEEEEEEEASANRLGLMA